MPVHQSHLHTSARPPVSVSGRTRAHVVWVLTVATVILLLPVLVLETPPATTTAEAWLDSDGAGLVPIQFVAAPSLMVDPSPVSAWPSDDEETSTDDTMVYHLGKHHNALRWLDGRAPPPRSPAGPNHLQYKLDPQFEFQNRDLRVNGMMIRLRIEF